MEFKDLAGFGEPIKKLVEVVAQGIGGVYKPNLIRRTADAKAYEIKKLADANKYKVEREAEAIHEVRQLLGNVEYVKGKLTITNPSDQAQISLPERIEDRKKYQEAKEQQNIEDITSIAAEELAKEETVSSEPVEDDWIARFFDYARLISDEQMQQLWGKILAGEVKQPYSYSLRTLELLRNLSKDEAEIFVKVAKLAIHHSGGAFVINPDHGKYLSEEFNISFLDWLLLSELGIIVMQDLKIDHLQIDELDTVIYTFGDSLVVLERPPHDPKLSLPIKRFTKLGNQLVNLVMQEENKDYLEKFALILHQHDAKVRYSKIIERHGKQIRHTGLQEFDFSSSDQTE